MSIHERAVRAARQNRKAEADLLIALQEVQREEVFRHLGYTSLHQYAVHALELSEAVASNFVTVARKAAVIPALQTAIIQGEIEVQKSRKITPVINLENQEEWIAKVKTLSSRDLEQEVARVCPREAVQERTRFVTAERMELRVGISLELEKKLRRIQDLESKDQAASLEDALEAMADAYLKKHDPLLKPANALASVTGRMSELSRRQAMQRDQAQCTYTDSRGRCPNRRWLDVHHIKPRARGGTHEPGNLVTLCSAHHKNVHVQPKRWTFNV